MPVGRCAVLLAALLLAGCGPGTPATPEVTIQATAEGGSGLRGAWQAEPLPLDAALLEAVDRECRDALQELIGPEFRLLVVDARGEGLLQAVFGDPLGRVATCEGIAVQPDGTVRSAGSGLMTAAGQDPARQPARFELLNGGGMGIVEGGGLAVARPGQRPYDRSDIIRWITFGTAGPGISSVVVDLPVGVRVTASLANGGYVAWWPGVWPLGTIVRGLDGQGAIVAETSP